ncbi:MAG: methylmalonyl Co-A mutase-associated GTPase MeaB [Flavobacteriales bacterium CG_4_9_14_3_um_filter_40_17]|nr:MAG: methylmalonyl Co-A mutase-associated GTPase MeaB [Flavobacteriales bacterium CG_4_9_14_3_um_filter_40_17]
MSKNKQTKITDASSRNTNPALASSIRNLRKKPISPQHLFEGIRIGNTTVLSQAITLIESNNPTQAKFAAELLSLCLPFTNQSVRIGITGVPGVGKSTFIENFGKLLTSIGKKVAVLAIDPSSSVTKGSILGDKTRMEQLVKDPNAYIRPSAAGESLGGVARKTRESIILCEAAGFDTILIETVGVGQSETVVHSMTDFFLLLHLTGAGDELQGIKRGIIEMADIIVINKADGDNLKRANREKINLQRALHIWPAKENGWTPPVMLCSSLENKGIEELWEIISSFFSSNKKNGFFDKKRAQQNEYWLFQAIEEKLKQDFFQNKSIQAALKNELQALHTNMKTPFEIAERLIETYHHLLDKS